MTLLSIITPVFNAQDTLPRMLESLKHIPEPDQPHVEVVIVDDGSSDRSLDILEAATCNEQLPSLTLRKQGHGGSGTARNTALECCRGEWILFLDADDELTANPVPIIRRHGNATCVAWSVRLQRMHGRSPVLRPRRITPENRLDLFTARNPITATSVLFRKDRIQHPFEPHVLFLEDWLFWLMNPGVFETMAVIGNTIGARIHLRPRTKTTDSVGCGRCRVEIAQWLLKEEGETLTRKQTNNLLVQAAVGKRQQGHRISLRHLLRLPCNAILYAKLWIYILRPFAVYR